MYLELNPLNLLEVGAAQLDTLWLRGGFPESLTAPSDARSLRWRHNFIRTYLERDIPQFGPRIAADTLRRFWRGFHAACAGLSPSRKLLIYPGTEPFPLAADIQAMPLITLCQELASTPHSSQ